MAATKYIFVTGGVTSSLGKGILAASLGKLLQSRGYAVTIQKFDPYLNIDPGTLNPYEHGECYVTDDGAETDLDLGHYERFLDTPTSQANNITTGRVYHNVMTKERQGEFLGKTIQVIPHITDEIQRNFELVAQKGLYDIIITEIGGCVGDIEALPFIEAIRQFKWGKKREDVMNIHLTLVPYLKSAGEIKTKPTQHSVRALSEAGIQPDVIVCRSDKKLAKDVREKISRFCNVETDAVISAYDMKSIYDVPIELKSQKLDEIALKKLNLVSKTDAKLEQWKEFLEKLKNPKQTVRIGLVGKYVQLPDAYKSIVESFIHAGAANECKVELKWILSDDLLTDEDVKNELVGLSGVLVAPGFGERGIEGKIKSIKYLREKKIPFFGICLGMQCAVMEYGRNVLGLTQAASTEQLPNTPNPVIDLMEDQKSVTEKGGTMRLGAYPCELKENTLAKRIYGTKTIYERHRHRYEFNNNYLAQYEKGGMTASGINPDSNLVEIVEIKDHPFFIGTQYHPELKSTVLKPQPIFVAFVKAALDYMNK
jgi:CTP synthase